MASPTEMILADLEAKYEPQAVRDEFARLYDEVEFGHLFAVLHQELNGHFNSINGRAKTTHHYWADPSREFLALIETLNEDLYNLKRAGVEVTLAKSYREAIEACEPWLSPSGGSPVPDDFKQIEVIRYEPVFSRPSTSVKLIKQVTRPSLQLVGEGSYANVFSFIDPDYGIRFALKRAKKGLSERDLARFKQEFAVMKRLSFPYVVAVYKYDDQQNEYLLEYCDETLRSFISKRNASLSFSSRKRIALQFLYAINYIHGQDLLHRDLSLQNVLVKVFKGGAVLVKLSDFGLVKETNSEFTRSQTEMRGTIRDPQLHSFKDYAIPNEMYSIGWVLSYIFSGRDSLATAQDSVGAIVRKCTAHEISTRYGTALELIADVENLEATPSDAPA